MRGRTPMPPYLPHAGSVHATGSGCVVEQCTRLCCPMNLHGMGAMYSIPIMHGMSTNFPVPIMCLAGRLGAVCSLCSTVCRLLGGQVLPQPEPTSLPERLLLAHWLHCHIWRPAKPS